MSTFPPDELETRRRAQAAEANAAEFADLVGEIFEHRPEMMQRVLDDLRAYVDALRRAAPEAPQLYEALLATLGSES